MSEKNQANKKDSRRILRQQLLTARDSIASEARRLMSQAITARLWEIDQFNQAELLFIYVNFRSEVETLPLIEQCLARGKRVAVPLTTPDTLLPCLITDPARELRPGFSSIPEPDPELAVLVDPAQIETIILPGSAFDPNGGRLGYAGGYYDRFLATKAPLAVRIGLAFEQQVVPVLPLLPHDKRLHFLVTEKRTIAVPP